VGTEHFQEFTCDVLSLGQLLLSTRSSNRAIPLRILPIGSIDLRYLIPPGRLSANELIEAAVACNARYLDTAYGANFTYNYYFYASFGFHGFDLCWTFPTHKLIIDVFGIEVDICPEIRLGSNPDYWRKYLVTFAKTANPNYAGQPASWTPFGSSGSAMYMDEFSSMRMIIDTGMPVDRCGFWQRAPYCKTCGFA
jgi:hypothetical protein